MYSDSFKVLHFVHYFRSHDQFFGGFSPFFILPLFSIKRHIILSNKSLHSRIRQVCVQRERLDTRICSFTIYKKDLNGHFSLKPVFTRSGILCQSLVLSQAYNKQLTFAKKQYQWYDLASGRPPSSY